MIEVYLHSASIDTDEGILSVEIQCHSSNESIPIELKQLNVDITNAVVTRYTSNNKDDVYINIFIIFIIIIKIKSIYIYIFN